MATKRNVNYFSHLADICCHNSNKKWRSTEFIQLLTRHFYKNHKLIRPFARQERSNNSIVDVIKIAFENRLFELVYVFATLKLWSRGEGERFSDFLLLKAENRIQIRRCDLLRNIFHRKSKVESFFRAHLPAQAVSCRSKIIHRSPVTGKWWENKLHREGRGGGVKCETRFFLHLSNVMQKFPSSLRYKNTEIGKWYRKFFP